MLLNQNQKYFEDIQVNDSWKSMGRTVTETDIVQFAGLSGDFNPLHMDAHFAKQTMFEQRIAHGLLGLSMSSGLQNGEGPLTVIAFMGLEWKFKKPIFIGDTVYDITSVDTKKEFGKEKGIVILKKKLVNQKNETVQEGKFTLLVARKPHVE